MSKIVADRLPIPPHIGDWLQVKKIDNFGAPESGLIWKASKKGIRVGAWAGCLMKRDTAATRSDWTVKFEGTSYLVSRIVYFLATSIDPGELQIDHIDRNPLNNNIDNLRLLTALEQKHNRRCFVNNTSGARGVSWHKHRRAWQVHVRHKGQGIHLGYFTCKLEAALAYNTKVYELFPGFYESKANDLRSLSCACSACKAR